MKMANGTGSITRESGNRRRPWRARVTESFDGGKQRFRTIGYYATKKEALLALADYVQNPTERAQKLNLGTLHEEWQNTLTVRPNTLRNYINAWVVLEPLKDRQVNSLTVHDYQNAFDRSGKFEPTLRLTKVILRQMLEYAYAHDYIDGSIVGRIKYLNVGSRTPNSHARSVFTESEIKELWQGDNWLNKALLVLIYSGLRISEFCNLESADIDLEQRIITVRQSKTKAGVRTVPIARKILPLINDALSVKLSREAFRSRLKSVYPNHTTHDTRHTFISLMADKGIDERITKRIVGHKGSGLTENIYTHLDFNLLLDSVDML